MTPLMGWNLGASAALNPKIKEFGWMLAVQPLGWDCEGMAVILFTMRFCTMRHQSNDALRCSDGEALNPKPFDTET